MAYHVFFHNGRSPSLGITLPRTEWEAATIHRHKRTDPIAQYLWDRVPEKGTVLDAPWRQTQTQIGYRGCGKINKLEHRVDLLFPLKREELRASLLSMSLILRDLLGLEEKDFTTEMVTGDEAHLLWGRVSAKFLMGLSRVRRQDLDIIEQCMEKAWRSAAPANLRSVGDRCRVKLDDGYHFSIECFGDACNVSGSKEGGFRNKYHCHNIDTPYQQATLLVGLATLHETVRMRS